MVKRDGPGVGLPSTILVNSAFAVVTAQTAIARTTNPTDLQRIFFLIRCKNWEEPPTCSVAVNYSVVLTCAAAKRKKTTPTT